MKRVKFISIVVCILALVSGFSMQAQAALELRGTDSLGNRLIYDTDFDITWYDYSNAFSSWDFQVAWADALTVDFRGTILDDWRLPTTVDVSVWDYDGTPKSGYNITSSELGHLFYTELGNNGWYDTSGNPTGCSWSSPHCLTNTGDFQNLLSNEYMSGTEYAPNTSNAWAFSMPNGRQYYTGKGTNKYAMAVMDGMAVVPEPISSTLFILGGATFGLRFFWKKFKKQIFIQK
jgi:hypothetical protein